MKTFACLVFLLTALSGCATGVPRDSDGRPYTERLPPSAAAAPAPQRLTLREIVALEQKGHAPQEIVSQVRANGQRISKDALKALRELGASPALLHALGEAETQAKETDRITKETDRLAEQRTRVEYVRTYRYYDPYPYWGYPYWGYPVTYFGYHSGYRHGWAGGAFWAW